LPDVNGKPVKDAADFFLAGGTVEQLQELVRTVQEFTAQAAAAADAINPNTWFKKKFPMLAATHGEPVALRTPMNGRPSVQDLNESFLAATLGQESNPEAPTVFIRQEARFYSYRPEQGIFGIASEEELSAWLSDSLLACARDCRETCDVSALEFQYRDTAALTGAVKRARAVIATPDDFFLSNSLDFLPVANGMLRLEDRVLLPFGPDYRRRNKLAVPYVPGARCPMFEDTLLRTSLEDEDIGLLQRWSGLALCGRNIAQRILILSGTAGAGKGTFIRILKGVIGEANIGSLRTDKLNERFEIGRLLNKTLLYGADVPANFLNMGSASVLKSLTGGDPMTVEFKGSMDSPSLTCAFNVIVTSNSRLTVHLEGDVDAWQRRLAIIAYTRPKPANVIPDLDERIMAKEGPGVLNWMLDGLYALRAANWQLALCPRQQSRVNELLLESDSMNEFFTECTIADSLAPGITVSETYGAYADFCMNRGWSPVDRYLFGREAPDIVQRLFRLVPRHDIKGSDGKSQRGWKTLRLRAEGEGQPDLPDLAV
jgi:putative DNA primase/helicase